MQVETLPIASLLAAPYNPRRMSTHDAEALKRSLSEYGAVEPAVVNADNTIVGGHMRVQAAQQLGWTEFPVVRVDLPPDKAKLLNLALNRIHGEWDESLLEELVYGLQQEGADLLLSGFGQSEIDALLQSVGAAGDDAAALAERDRLTLAERFGVPPFSVLDARQGYWQERKRAWLALGIQSELGRGDVTPGQGGPNAVRRLAAGNVGDAFAYKNNGLLGFSEQAEDYRQRRGGYKNGGPGREIGQDLMRGEHVLGTSTKGSPETASLEGGLTWPTSIHPYDVTGKKRNAQFNASRAAADQRSNLNGTSPLPDWATGTGTENMASGTSIFDPVLCELAYRWFCPAGGGVLDPFAGGSVRGIVATYLGLSYTGIDLRPEQVAANEHQAQQMGLAPRWIVGDSRSLETLAPEPADLVFSCPPYFDLEQYSEDEADLSNAGDYAAFLEAYRAIIAAACARLRPDRFACFVVGEVRDGKGLYRGLVPDTIRAFEDAGLRLYNEAILVTAVGSLPIRVGAQFGRYRKLGKTHQNVLAFFNGDPRRIPDALGEVPAASWLEPQAEGNDLAS